MLTMLEDLVVQNIDKWRQMVEDVGAYWIGVQWAFADEEPLVLFEYRQLGSFRSTICNIPVSQMSPEAVQKRIKI